MNYQGRGRGRGRGRSHAGRGHGNNRSNRNNNSSNNNSPKEYKFSPQSNAGRTQTATYATVKEIIIQQVQKWTKGGMDVAKSLKDLKVIDLEKEEPKRLISEKKDQERAIEQDGMNIKYQEELRRHLDRKDALKEGLNRAYAFIIANYCTKAMCARVEEHPNYSTIEDDPIELLVVLKTLMHDSVRAQYPMVSMTDALARLINVKQYENETLLDYVKRFKQLRDVVKSQLGYNFLDGYVEHQADYPNASKFQDAEQEESKIKTASEEDQAKQDEMKGKAFEQWMAYLLIRGSDQAKYGSLLKGFVSQFSLENDQYPKTIATAIDVLSNHKIDPKFYENRRNRGGGRQNSAPPSTENNGDQSTATSFAQQMTCYCCGQSGHGSRDCPKRDSTPKDQWFVNRAMSHHQQSDARPDTDNDDSSVSDVDDDDRSVQSERSAQSTRSTSSRNRRSGGGNSRSNRSQNSWHGFQRRGYQGFCANNQVSFHKNKGMDMFSNLKDVLILDSGSVFQGTIGNPDLIANIRPSRYPMGMSTNAGSKTLTLEGDILGMEDPEDPNDEPTWFDPTSIANVLSLAKLAKKHRITFDSAIDTAFNVHTKGGIVKFEQTPEGLYAFKPPQSYLEAVAATKNMRPPTKTHGADYLMSTVNENRKGYTHRQFESAKAARRLYHIVGCPTVTNFKHILRQNLIKNCPCYY